MTVSGIPEGEQVLARVEITKTVRFVLEFTKEDLEWLRDEVLEMLIPYGEPIPDEDLIDYAHDEIYNLLQSYGEKGRSIYPPTLCISEVAVEVLDYEKVERWDEKTGKDDT